MSEMATLTGLNWVADAPGDDPTARFTTAVTINSIPFRLVAHRVQRPAAAGWISDEDLEALPCDADGLMAMDGEAWKHWWQEFEALPDDDESFDVLPEPEDRADTAPLEDQHRRLWELLCSTDDPQRIWKRPEGAYIIFGWPVKDTGPEAVASVEVAFGTFDIDGWANARISIEGVPCILSGPVANWEPAQYSWSQAEDHAHWITEIEAATGQLLIPIAYPDKAHPRVFATLSPENG